MAAQAATQVGEPVPRVNTPPPHTTLQMRQIVPVRFSALRPKEVRTNSNVVAWNCDGKKLLSCGLERGCRGWQLDNFDERSTFTLTAPGIADYVTSVDGSPLHPDLLCAASERDKKIVFWDFRVKTATRVVDSITAVRSIKFSRDGETVLVRESPESGGDGSDTVAVFDVRAGLNIHRVSARDIGVGDRIKDVKFNHTGKLVYVAGESGALAILDFPSLEFIHKIDAQLHECTAIGVDLRGKYLATGGADAIVNLWDPVEWIGLKTISSCESPIINVGFSYDGEYVASSCDAGYIDITETETGTHDVRLAQRSTPKSLAWHPMKPILASAGGERRSEAWISLLL